MGLKVPYLADAGIEASANALLADYARRKKIDVRPPVPVEDILEDHLGLHLGFDDLRTRLGVPDVLGSLWIERAEVIVDQTLDPDEHPSALTRYRFTLGHEIGHWDLHRGLVLAQRLQADLFQKSSGPSIICRTSQRKEPIEWQADAFAAALLMPKPAVAAFWQRLMGPAERLKVSELKGRAGPFLVAAALLGRGCASRDARSQQNAAIEAVVRPLAEAFEVSPAAMRIRLEQLGFVTHDLDTTVPLFGAV
jgi:IrrE N-terminal-like domain